MRIAEVKMLRIIALVLFLAALAAPGLAQGVQSPPALLTVVANPADRIVLRLEPGFNLFLVFDANIEFVAVGDEQVLAVSARGQEGIIGLRALVPAGRTNMHVQAGGVLVVFEVRVGREPRTADVVRVITRPAAAMGPGQEEQKRTQTREPGSEPQAPAAPRPPAPPARPRAPVLTSELLPNPVSFLTEEGTFRLVEVAERGVRALFQAYRTPSGIEVRYQIANTSGVPWQVISSRVLVRADERIVPARILRHTPSPDGRTLAHGTVETGVIVLLEGARTVRVTFPLFPEVLDPRRLPIVFEVEFREMTALPEVKLR
jgi:hypothetical protein